MGTQTTGTQPSPGRMMFGTVFNSLGTLLTQGRNGIPQVRDMWKQFRESVGGMRSTRGPTNG